MDPSVTIATFTLGGVAATAVVGLLAQVTVASMQRRREREARREQRESDFLKWQREQFVATLGKTVKSVNLFISSRIAYQDSRDKAQDDPELRKISAEMQAELNTLAVVIYPAAESSEYSKLMENLDKAAWTAVPDVEPMWEIRQLLMVLAQLYARRSRDTGGRTYRAAKSIGHSRFFQIDLDRRPELVR